MKSAGFHMKSTDFMKVSGFHNERHVPWNGNVYVIYSSCYLFELNWAQAKRLSEISVSKIWDEQRNARNFYNQHSDIKNTQLVMNALSINLHMGSF